MQGHADDLVIDSLLVSHLEHAHRLHRDQAARERRLIEAYERVERVSVLGERVAQVAVVGRVCRRAHQQAIELDAP